MGICMYNIYILLHTKMINPRKSVFMMIIIAMIICYCSWSPLCRVAWGAQPSTRQPEDPCFAASGEEILHHQKDGWKPINNGMFTTIHRICVDSSVDILRIENGESMLIWWKRGDKYSYHRTIKAPSPNRWGSTFWVCEVLRESDSVDCSGGFLKRCLSGASVMKWAGNT